MFGHVLESLAFKTPLSMIAETQQSLSSARSRIKLSTWCPLTSLLTLCMLYYYFLLIFISKFCFKVCKLHRLHHFFLIDFLSVTIKQVWSQIMPCVKWDLVWIKIVCNYHQRSKSFQKRIHVQYWSLLN